MVLRVLKKTFIHRSVSYDLQEFNNAKEYFSLLEKKLHYLRSTPKKRENTQAI